MSPSLQNAARSTTPAGRSSVEGVAVDIAAGNPGCMRESDIASAWAELNVVLGETASATSAILEAIERIRTIAAALPGKHGAVLTIEVIRILEACTFEGLIGERLINVIRLLKDACPEVSGREKGCVPGAFASRAGDIGLLSRRQLPSVAWTQADIDAILDGGTSRRSGAKRKKPSR